MRRFETTVRILGRVIVIIGLVAFYGSFASNPFGPSETLAKAGIGTAAVGCFWLTALLLWLRRSKGRVVFEATLGFFCLPPAFLSMFAAAGDEMGLQLSWLIITILIFAGTFGLLGQATPAKRAAERWRNTGRDE